MATRWGIDHDGRRLEIEPESQWSGETLHLFVDGEEVAQHKRQGSPITVSYDGLEVTAKLAWHGSSIISAELKAGEDLVPLEPEPGSRAARKEQFKRERPGLYAARHVAKAVGKVLVPLLGLGLLLNLLPEISIDIPIDLPSIPFPDIPFPSIDLPSIDLPELPGWVKAIVESAKYWGPILVAIVIAVSEWRKRRRSRPETSRR